ALDGPARHALLRVLPGVVRAVCAESNGRARHCRLDSVLVQRAGRVAATGLVSAFCIELPRRTAEEAAAAVAAAGDLRPRAWIPVSVDLGHQPVAGDRAAEAPHGPDGHGLRCGLLRACCCVVPEELPPSQHASAAAAAEVADARDAAGGAAVYAVVRDSLSVRSPYSVATY